VGALGLDVTGGKPVYRTITTLAQLEDAAERFQNSHLFTELKSLEVR
jgi:hypothetical protein